MKYISLAMLGAVAATNQDDGKVPLGAGACVNWNLDAGRFWDLKEVDALHRTGKNPAHINFGYNFGSKQDFWFKTCQLPYNFDADAFKAGTFKTDPSKVNDNVSTAYWAKDGKAEYAFKGAKTVSIPAVHHDDGSVDRPDGWTITWNGGPCEKDSSKDFTVTMNGICDATKENQAYSNIKESSCSSSFDIVGKEACGHDIPIVEIVNKVSPFFGLILILAGVWAAFFGRRQIDNFIGGLAGLGSATITFGMIYALFLPVDVKMGMFIGVVVASLIVGGLIGFCVMKLVDAWGVAIASSACGVLVTVQLVQTVKHVPGKFMIPIAIVGGIGGFLLGRTFRKQTMTVATACIGSFLAMRGVGCYAPGYPSGFSIDGAKADPNAAMMAAGYLVGFLVVAGLGGYYQFHTLEDEKDMMGELEGGDKCDDYELV